MVCWTIDLYLSTKSHIYITLSKPFVLFCLPDIFTRKSRIIDEIESNFFPLFPHPLLHPIESQRIRSRVQNERKRKKKKTSLYTTPGAKTSTNIPSPCVDARKKTSGIDARIRDIERRGVDSCGSGGQKRERLNASRSCGARK